MIDVGFGDNFLTPLKFETDIIQKDDAGFFKIIKEGDRYKLKRSSDGKNFKDEYLFSVQEEKLSNFNERCTYQQTSPESHFTQKRICSKATENGRITLSDLRIIINEKGIKSEIQLKDENEFLESLKKYFEIVL